MPRNVYNGMLYITIIIYFMPKKYANTKYISVQLSSIHFSPKFYSNYVYAFSFNKGPNNLKVRYIRSALDT